MHEGTMLFLLCLLLIMIYNYEIIGTINQKN